MIFPLSSPKKPEGGLAILNRNIAPDGAVIKKKNGVKESMYYFEGRARIFHSMEEACEAVSGDKIKQGDILVITYEEPKGDPRMREMHIDIPNCTLTLCVPDEEIQKRLKEVRHLRKERTSALDRYSALITSADRGAVLKRPEEL